MAEESSNPGPASEQSSLTQAVEHEKALAHLELLQDQIDALRPTIPSMIGPLLSPADSKAQIYEDVRNAATQSMTGIKRLKQLWTSEQTQRVFAQSRDSLARDQNLSRADEVPAFGWGGE